jgi:hypothetical protein
MNKLIQTYKPFVKQEIKQKAEYSFAKWLSSQDSVLFSNIASIREDLLCDDGTGRTGNNIIDAEIRRIEFIKDAYLQQSTIKDLDGLIPRKISTVMRLLNLDLRRQYYNIIEKNCGDVFFLYKTIYEGFVEVKHSFDLYNGCMQVGIEFLELYSKERFKYTYKASPLRYIAIYPESKNGEFVLVHMFPFIDYVRKIYTDGKNIKTNSNGYKYIPMPIDLLMTRDFSITSIKGFIESIDSNILLWHYKGRK